MRAAKSILLALGCLFLLPAGAFAQASITGVVRDTSGAVLPGVTVEASSPALIEKSRSVVTDGSGQYRIVDLRPGTYDVTFSLSGFNGVKREGIELTGSFTATVNPEMNVGSVAETITVKGETPIVDVQSTTRQAVLGKEVTDAIPVGRSYQSLVVLIPGMTAGAQDVGGGNNLRLTANLAIHGGRAGDARYMEDGLTIRNIGAAGAFTNLFPDEGATQEVAIDFASGTSEMMTSGVRVNYIPKEGGNSFKGSFFGTFVNDKFQGDNFTQDLRDRGLRTPNSLKRLYDFNGSGGGPIVKDKLWFFASGRRQVAENYIAGLFYNKNAGDPTKWTYDPDLDRRGYVFVIQPSAGIRTTWQATPKNKFSFFYDHQPRDYTTTSTTSSPESASEFVIDSGRIIAVGWTSPATSRVLIEARVATHAENLHNGAWPENPNDPYRSLIAVTEQGGLIPNLLYRGAGQQNGPTFIFAVMNAPNIWEARVSLTYVTGAHAFKVGFVDGWGRQELLERDITSSTSYRFNNGVPNLITMRASPVTRSDDMQAELGIFAQDRWTIKRLTVNGGIRFDYFKTYFPDVHLGPGPLVPTRNFTIPQYNWYNWKDISPRMGAVYDLFGNGKTAVKVAAGRYISAGDPTVGNVFGALANTVTRSWTDANSNFSPDCDLLNLQSQDLRATGGDFCGIVSDLRFGQAIPTTNNDPETKAGWFKRPYNWEFSAGVQQQLSPRVGLDVSYFRRLFGNFTATDNRLVTGADFSPFSVTAPTDPRLPNGGGYTLAGSYNLNPDKVGLVDNYVTFSDNFGKRIEHWNGVDVTMNARLRQGVVVQGGVSTGRTSTDDCDLSSKLDNPSQLFCHVDTAFRTQVKFLGTYMVPKIDVQIAGTYQSIPGPQLTANVVFTNAQVQTSLGRPLSGGAANVTVNVVEPGTMYGERLNQLDLRFAKIFRLARTRTALNFDIANTFNSNPVLSQSITYSNWLTPTGILDARLFKISVQVDF